MPRIVAIRAGGWRRLLVDLRLPPCYGQLFTDMGPLLAILGRTSPAPHRSARDNREFRRNGSTHLPVDRAHRTNAALSPRTGQAELPRGRRWSNRSLAGMRAVQITRFGGPEVLDVVDLPDPVPSDGQQLYDVSAAGLNYGDTHHRLSAD